MDAKIIAKYLDFANHHQDATEAKIRELCQKVLEYGFHSAFVNPHYVPLAKEILSGRAIVGTVVSFPLGQEAREIKVASAHWAVKNGADELDCCPNFGSLKEGRYNIVLAEMKAIVAEAKNQQKNTVVKFIVEAGLFSDDEIKKEAELIVTSGADFVKICSGLGPRGAQLSDVALVKSVIGDKAKIKVAGGITTYQQTVDFISAGVSRIGTSHGPQIVDQSISSAIESEHPGE